MTYFLIYILFALTTAIAAVYELAYPVLSERIKTHDDVENVPIWYFSHFIIFLMIAPLVLLPCIIPSWGQEFRHYLSKSLFQD